MANYVVALNPINFGITTYSLPWSGVVCADSTVYGVSATKLQLLTGVIEETATPAIETGDILMADGAICNVSDMYLQISTSTDMKMTATSSENGSNASHDYVVETNGETALKERADWLGRGAEGAYWRFKFSKNTALACNFLLLKFDVLIGKIRHRRGAKSG